MEERDGRREELDLSNLEELFPELFTGSGVVDDSKGPALSITAATTKAGVSKKYINGLVEDGYLETWKEGPMTMLYYRELLKATWEASDRGKGPMPGIPGRPKKRG